MIEKIENLSIFVVLFFFLAYPALLVSSHVALALKIVTSIMELEMLLCSFGWRLDAFITYVKPCG